MRDDVEFNVQFIELIEGNSSLYDYNRRDYGNRNVQDKVWQTIATKLKESVADCKERWKNIRGRYLKYIKKVPPSGSAAKTVKMYYLADNLHFLDKFLRSRPARGNMTQSQNIEEIQVDENFNAPGNNRSAENSDVENEVDPSPPNLTPPTMPRNPLSTIQLTTSSGEETDKKSALKKVPQIAEGNKRKKMTPTLNDVNASAINYFEERKKNLQKNKVDVGGDPDMAFFHSILPDMKSMDGGQKRQFKIGILNLAGQILQGSSNNVTLCSPTINYQSPNPNESRPESRENSVPRMVNSMMESVNDETTYPLFTPFSPVSTVSSHGATRHMDHMQLASALNEPIDMTENVESTFITYL